MTEQLRNLGWLAAHWTDIAKRDLAAALRQALDLLEEVDTSVAQ